jgi:ATP-dependent Clp protease ATP-binding subunit ClpA
VFDRFTDEAKEAVKLAREVSRANDTGDLDDVHVLIGYCRARGSLAVRLVTACAVQPERVELEAQERAAGLPRLPSGSRQVPFTHGTKRSLEVAVEEASPVEHTSIRTHHRMLGPLQGHSATADVLPSTGVTLDVARMVAGRLQADVEPPHAPALEEGLRSEVAVIREAFENCMARQWFDAAAVLRDVIYRLEYPR